MRNEFKVMVGTSAHWFALKSGQLKYQKRKPSNPVWRILVAQEPGGILYFRLFAQQPTAAEIESTISDALSFGTADNLHVLIPDAVERLCPGLRDRLVAAGCTVYLPNHGFAAGARVAREWEDAFKSLSWHLGLVRESMACVAEIEAACGHPRGLICVAGSEDLTSDRSRYRVFNGLANEITRRRGRDPESGFEQRMNEPSGGQLNSPTRVAPTRDALESLLEKTETSPGYGLTEWGETLRYVALALRELRQAGEGQGQSLLRELGTWALVHHFDQCLRDNPHAFSHISFELRDKNLKALLSRAVQEALKAPVDFGDFSLLGLASRIEIHYPAGCDGVSLRGIPAHHHLEKMFGERIGPRFQAAIDPGLQAPDRPVSSVFGLPNFNQWFRYRRLCSRTPLSPASCFEQVTEKCPRRDAGLLVAWVMLPHALTLLRLPGDVSQVAAMTSLVNERLSRTGHGVTCTIGVWRPVGEVLDFGG